MTAPLIDVLDWVEELREDLRGRLSHPESGTKLNLDPAKCGTSANYRQHLRLGIPPCASCRAVETYRTWKYRERNGDKVRENRRRWYAANKGDINRRKREWRAGR